MKTARRRQLVKNLLETACRSAQWSDPSAPASERISALLAAQRLVVETSAVALRATLGETDGLTIGVRLQSAWTRLAEAELYDALMRDRSAIAELVLLDWSHVRAACSAAAERDQVSAA